MKTTIGNYDAFIYSISTDSDETQIFDSEPFSYTAIARIKDDKRWFITMCNDIPCDDCIFSTDCKNGANRNDVLTKYLLEQHPELII